MKVEETRFVRGGKRAVMAALASILLASCATSETDVPFGFADMAPIQQTGDSAEFGSFATATATETVMSEDDPALPSDVADAPSLRPVSEDEAAMAAAGQPSTADGVSDEAVAANPEAVTQEQNAALALAEPQPDDAAGQPDEAEHMAAGQEPAEQQATQFIENTSPAQAAALAPAEPKKRGLLAFFSNGNKQAAQQPTNRGGAVSSRDATSPSATITASTSPSPQPIVQLASTGQAAQPLIARATAGGEDALPGVRKDNLFEITRRSGLDDDADIDLHEDSSLYQVASVAPGLARLAPNGLVTQNDHVDVACLKPSLVRVLKAVERNYGRKVIVTSGYRSAERNRKARGARNSLHMYCAAADVQVEGVSKWDLAQFVRSMPGRGGVGTYCHTESVHIDVGPERDWNWRCRRRK